MHILTKRELEQSMPRQSYRQSVYVTCRGFVVVLYTQHVYWNLLPQPKRRVYKISIQTNHVTASMCWYVKSVVYLWWLVVHFWSDVGWQHCVAQVHFRPAGWSGLTLNRKSCKNGGEFQTGEEGEVSRAEVQTRTRLVCAPVNCRKMPCTNTAARTNTCVKTPDPALEIWNAINPLLT